jgi:excisionase family DNA binding protein
MATDNTIEHARLDDDFLTVEEAAQRAKMSVSSIYHACDEKQLAHYRVSGKGRRGKILIRPADLDAFLESCRVEVGSLPERSGFTHRRV